MNVYWLEQTEADVPAESAWLSANEIAKLDAMRFAKRRTDWRLGRWVAKNALAAYLNLPDDPCVLARVEIRPAASGAPEVFVANKPAAVSISLSHRDGMAACAVTSADAEVGCDLELVESHSEAFISDYFTAEERALVAQAFGADRFRLLALLWSAKESALKALHMGLRLSTQSVIVKPVEGFDLNGWSPLQVRCPGDRIFRGWWQYRDDIVRTLVANPTPDTPIRLRDPSYFPEYVPQCA